MAYFIASENLQGKYEDSGNTILIVKYDFEVDTESDLPAQNQFSSDGVKIAMTSTAHVITSNKKYEMKSDGTWVDITNAPSTYDASDIIYDNTESGMTATNVQDAVDELNTEKQDTLTFDTTPTQGSTNPVTSGGVYEDQQRQETEIGVVANAGAKNFAPIETSANRTDNHWIIGKGTGNVEKIDLPAGRYIFTAISESSGSGQCQIKLKYSDGTTGLSEAFSFGSAMTLAFTASKTVVGYGVYSNPAPVTFEKMMIRPAAITDATFQPYARTNPELTVLTDEDRDSLIELVDGGAKNKLHYNGISAPSGDTANISFSCSGDTITITGSTSSNAAWCYLTLNGSIVTVNDFCNGKYFLSSERTGSGTADVFAYESGVGQFADDSGNGVVIPNKSTSNAVRIMVNIPKDATVNITLKIMICTAADWAVSLAFVPYRPSWQEMWDAIQALQSGGNRALTMQTQSLQSVSPDRSVTESEEIDER